MNHPDHTALLRYIADRGTDDDLREIDRHLLECEDCFLQVRGLRYLSENFDSILDSCTPQEHGRLYREWRVAEALAKMPSPSDREARRWLKLLKENLLMTVRCKVDHVKKVVGAVAETMPAGYQLASEAAPAGVGTIPESGEESTTVDLFNRQSVTRNILCEDKIVGQLMTDGIKQRIFVKCWPSQTTRTPDFVLLLPEGESGEPRQAKFEPVEGADYLLAEFLDLEDGDYMVVLAPTTST